MVRGKLVVALTGASGARYGVGLLEALKNYPEIEVHLIVSEWGERTLAQELGCAARDLRGLCAVHHDVHDLAASISSGSVRTCGMVVIPCSMNTLAEISEGSTANLISRAAAVTIKEGRKLILVTRETPLSPIYLEHMLRLARLGVVIAPPVPAFYAEPSSIDDIVRQTVGRVLNWIGLDTDLIRPWGEPQAANNLRPSPPERDTLRDDTLDSHWYVSASRGEGRLRVTAEARMIGPDILACIHGGEAPHIGAIGASFASPSAADPKKMTGTPNVLTFPGHKEYELASFASLTLSRALGRSAVVTIGIHVDNATTSEIQALVTNAKRALADLITNLGQSSGA